MTLVCLRLHNITLVNNLHISNITLSKHFQLILTCFLPVIMDILTIIFIKCMAKFQCDKPYCDITRVSVDTRNIIQNRTSNSVYCYCELKAKQIAKRNAISRYSIGSVHGLSSVFKFNRSLWLVCSVYKLSLQCKKHVPFGGSGVVMWQHNCETIWLKYC